MNLFSICAQRADLHLESISLSIYRQLYETTMCMRTISSSLALSRSENIFFIKIRDSIAQVVPMFCTSLFTVKMSNIEGTLQKLSAEVLYYAEK